MERSIAGYQIIIQQREKDYILSVPTLHITVRNQNRGAGIKEIYKKVSEELNKRDQNNSIPEIDFNEDYHGKLQHRMFFLNDFLNRFGFFINGDYFNRGDFRELEKIREEYLTIPSHTNDQIQVIGAKISKILLPRIILPDSRALVMTALIMPTNHLKKYGHLIEQAFISLMRGEYISVIMILTPVLEGVLRSLSDFDFRVDNTDDRKLINNLCGLDYNNEIASMTHPYLFDEYVRCFVNIFNNVFYKEHQCAEENYYFNRHYILHLMGDGAFYTRDNAMKLIMLIDLLGYIISCNTGQNIIFEKNKEDIDYKIRFEYYFLQIKQIDDQYLRTKILEQHESYQFTSY